MTARDKFPCVGCEVECFGYGRVFLLMAGHVCCGEPECIKRLYFIIQCEIDAGMHPTIHFTLRPEDW